MNQHPLGENVRKYRIKIGLSQRERGSRVGVSGGMIARIETGSKDPSIVLGEDIAKALGCTIIDLLSKNTDTSHEKIKTAPEGAVYEP